MYTCLALFNVAPQVEVATFGRATGQGIFTNQQRLGPPDRSAELCYEERSVGVEYRNPLFFTKGNSGLRDPCMGIRMADAWKTGGVEMRAMLVIG